MRRHGYDSSMAGIPALVEALAPLDPRGRATIAQFSREVRNAGLIKSEKRGRGGATVTFKDAATLLLAVCGSPQPSGAAEAVQRLWSLRLTADDRIDRLKRADLPERLAFLGDRLLFGETVERLIENAPVLEAWAEEYLANWFPDEPQQSAAAFSMNRMAVRNGGRGAAQPVRIVCYFPAPFAEIHLGFPWAALDEDDAYHGYFGRPAEVSGAGVTMSIEAHVEALVSLHRAVI